MLLNVIATSFVRGASCASIDSQIANFFRAHLSPTFADVLWWITGAGCEIWITSLVIVSLGFLLMRRRWHAVVAILLTVPCGTLLGEIVKYVVQRQRPFVSGPFGNWGGYSFPSGHTLAATLLYGTFAALLAHKINDRFWRNLMLGFAGMIILAVAFSRVALGAHYLSDVLAAMLFGGTWVVVSTRAADRLRPKQQPVSPILPISQKLAA